MAVSVRWAVVSGEYRLQVRIGAGPPAYLTMADAIQLVAALRHCLTTTLPPWPDNENREH